MNQRFKVTTVVLSSVVLTTGCTLFGGEKKIEKKENVQVIEDKKADAKKPSENEEQLSLDENYEKENSLGALLVSGTKKSKTSEKSGSVLDDISNLSQYVIAAAVQPIQTIAGDILNVVIPADQPTIIPGQGGTTVVIPVIPGPVPVPELVPRPVPEPGPDDSKDPTPQKEILALTIFIPNDTALWGDHQDYNLLLKEHLSGGMDQNKLSIVYGQALKGLQDNNLFFNNPSANLLDVQNKYQLLALGQGSDMPYFGLDLAQLAASNYQQNVARQTLYYLNGPGNNAIPEGPNDILKGVTEDLLAVARQSQDSHVALALYQLVANTNVNHPEIQKTALQEMESLIVKQIPAAAVPPAEGTEELLKLDATALYEHALQLLGEKNPYDALFYAQQAYNRADDANKAQIKSVVEDISKELLQQVQDNMEIALNDAKEGKGLKVDDATQFMLERISISDAALPETQLEAREWKAFISHWDEFVENKDDTQILYHVQQASQFAKKINRADIAELLQSSKKFQDAADAVDNKASEALSASSKDFHAAQEYYNLLLTTEGVKLEYKQRAAFVKYGYLDQLLIGNQYLQQQKPYEALSVFNAIQDKEQLPENVRGDITAVADAMYNEAEGLYKNGDGTKDDIAIAYKYYKAVAASISSKSSDAQDRMKSIEKVYDVKIEEPKTSDTPPASASNPAPEPPVQAAPEAKQAVKEEPKQAPATEAAPAEEKADTTAKGPSAN